MGRGIREKSEEGRETYAALKARNTKGFSLKNQDSISCAS